MAWSRAIGLSSRRLSRRTRYAPNDRLLKTLVISVVNERMQFDEFLHEIRSRYGFVIGDAEGAHLVKAKLVDQESSKREPREPRGPPGQPRLGSQAFRLSLVHV